MRMRMLMCMLMRTLVCSCARSYAHAHAHMLVRMLLLLTTTRMLMPTLMRLLAGLAGDGAEPEGRVLRRARRVMAPADRVPPAAPAGHAQRDHPHAPRGTPQMIPGCTLRALSAPLKTARCVGVCARVVCGRAGAAQVKLVATLRRPWERFWSTFERDFSRCTTRNGKLTSVQEYNEHGCALSLRFGVVPKVHGHVGMGTWARERGQVLVQP